MRHVPRPTWLDLLSAERLYALGSQEPRAVEENITFFKTMKYVLKETSLPGVLQKRNALPCKTNHFTSYMTWEEPAKDSIIL
jgi:hypothetical protein